MGVGVKGASMGKYEISDRCVVVFFDGSDFANKSCCFGGVCSLR